MQLSPKYTECSISIHDDDDDDMCVCSYTTTHIVEFMIAVLCNVNSLEDNSYQEQPGQVNIIKHER